MEKIKFKFKTLLILLMMSCAFISCSSDDDGTTEDAEGPEEPTVEAVVLSCSTITEAMVLENRGAGIDYIWPCHVKVEAPLTIEPGVTIAFEQGGGMHIKDYGDRTGALTAVGTADEPITFTGTNETPGAWNDIYMNSGDLNNKLHYVIIEYAGATDGSKAALANTSGSKVEMQHTTIRKNKSDGVYVSGSANIEGWKANTITENQGYPIEIAARKIKFLDGTQSTYTDNGTNQIYVNSGSIYNRGFIEDEVGGPTHTWQDPGIPFFIDEDVTVRKDSGNEKPGHLVITEGCEFIFNEGYGLKVDNSNTSLEIFGTPDSPVNFSGQYGAGSWYGINIRESKSNLNTIENTIIADAGEDTWSWFSQKGGISLGDQTGRVIQLNLTNVHINNTDGCGVVERGLKSGSNISYNNVTYSDNTGDDICEE